VDRSVYELLEQATPDQTAAFGPILTLGLHHEQQHQELLLTDLKHAFSLNPLQPIYLEKLAPQSERTEVAGGSESPAIAVAGGLAEVGHSGDGFCFDNELPRHEVWLRDFRIAASPVSNGSYLGFIRDGGYSRPELWLSDGWDRVLSEGWAAPLYWLPQGEGSFSVFTLAGPLDLDLKAAVTHLSYYEADAFARWAGVRLPTEFEWEHFTQKVGADAALGSSLEDGAFHPTRHPGPGPQHLLGEVWEWTSSAYAAYPGFRTLGGALGEYNGKFMSGGMVLRGGSCVTPRDHVRPSYRNFFAADKRWQFSGLRLAADG
jgi:ergothioneine biosynthesis protein EgtB